MGEVYLAEHPELSRHVALKRFVYNQAAGDDEETAKARFVREGKALARLSHQGVVGVFDLFEWRKEIYLALEYVDGFDLSKLLKDGALGPEIASIIAKEVAEALEHAHYAGIVHRDVKASNVMVSRRGEVKLMDFGIARQDLLEPMTKTGMVVGTPMYVAPEVVAGQEADARADIYALGALLYYAVSGRRLFAHAKQHNLFTLITAGRFPRLGKVAPDTPRELRRIVRRCLERKPEQRYTSAAEVRRALELYLGNRGVWAHSAPRLVEFLRERGHFTDADLEGWQVPSAGGTVLPESAPARKMPWLVISAGIGLAVATDWLFFGQLTRAVEWASAWLSL